MKYIVLILYVFITSCSYETLSPQAVFEYEASIKDAKKAKALLQEIAHQSDLLLTENLVKYHSTTTLQINLERSDGLKIALSSISSLKKLTIAIHCHNECKEWKRISEKVNNKFNEQWKRIN